ncbi:MAG: N-acetylneuraminate synthase [Chloroflexi bacterium]|jgi:N-acetylneuraminate synthase|nr:N-acetylneuraminate synthase family protein [Anaerolineaceae bacterium]NLI45253.1 N-acetylneuraminate synthase [Chloroflexota bacterium]HOE34386.1 N-acetylneuraminate synthase family protein [Anaerolineaceae bacterium]HOT26510.1 N-acetylneuraminate synthase family protein [Anaerolineaceae bacterium]HQK02932.1 N-acetylneuraminate synthase family protein [Anaerolineaceae bacterium]
MEISIGKHLIGDAHPTYFIADIAANHDGSLDRALELIRLCAEAGANAAKFQNFRGPKIVSDYGFRHMNAQVSHQAKWRKSVVEVYNDASIPFEWTPILKQACDEAGIDYFSSPYDFEAIDMLDPYVPAYKIGSGDITWLEACLRIAAKGKPVLLAAGASDIGDVQRAVDAILSVNPQLVLMQCNTNYTAADGNFDNIHLNVLKTFRAMYPQLVLGLSDHTHGHATVLGAVALGARVVEKHFTDDNSREGPDHAFAMNPRTWAEMVTATRQLERALGSGNKHVAENERETVVIQRRCLRAARPIQAGEVLTRDMIDVLRPAPAGAIMPYDIQAVLGTRALVDIEAGQELRWTMLGA